MSLDDERRLAHLESRWLEPPFERKPKCRCGEYPSYLINDRPVCDWCVGRYAESALPYDEEECSCCEDMVSEGYRIGGFFYCERCFEKQFQIE